MRSSTTIKLSVETRDRLKALGGPTYEDTIVEAVDALEAERFWAQADAAETWFRSLPAVEQTRHREREAEIDAAFARIR